MVPDARVLERASRALASLPPVNHALAYGSAVLADAVVAAARAPALDLLLAVDDPAAWHEMNMRKNPSHYASHVRLAGARAIGAVSRAVGVDAHYNAALADDRGRGYKYGVIATADAVDDLRRWKYLFIAGRMHKPHVTMVASEAVRAAQVANVEFASRAALLTLPETFTELEFVRALVRLSYDGDVRFVFAAEDPQKVERIANGNVAATRSMYSGTLSEAFGEYVNASAVDGGLWRQDKSANAMRAHIAGLPSNVLARLVVKGERFGASGRDDDFASKGDAERVASAVRQRMREIVRVSSARQAFAALLSTSPLKVLAYLGAKFFKSTASRLER